MTTMTIPELYQNELKFWVEANRKFLGVTPIHEEDNFDTIQKRIDEDCKNYWNSSTPCKLARRFNDGTLNHDANFQKKNSYRLSLNFLNMCIDVFGTYPVTDKKSGEVKDKELKIASIPTPCDDLCWIINRSHYVPRVTAIRDNYSIIKRKDYETIIGEGWIYDIKNDTFTCNVEVDKYKFEPTIEEIYNNHVSIRSRYLLEGCLKKPLTIDNFKEALIRVPEFKPESIYNFKFSRLEYFEAVVLDSRKYAQPLKSILLGVARIIGSNKEQYSTTGYQFEGYLIRSESKIFALENFRTCCNIYKPNSNTKKAFIPEFTYTNTNGFFDSFKTATTKSAGRQRLLLDNVVVSQGMLWIVDDDGEMHNMYEYIGCPQEERLSCLSKAPFCNNDKPKRIMMNAKMTAQAVTLKDESDDLTHRIMARVGFTDIEGYTYADSIVISESFAKKLRTYDSDILYLSKSSNLYKLIDSDPDLTDIYVLKQLYPTKNDAILDCYENVKIDHIDNVNDYFARVFITWEIPFRLGDKITNLHGAKGTVGKIIPDDQMPRLTKKVGHMEPGPLEIIISGFSTIRRGSLGQIFEAWANACDIDLSPEPKYPNGKDFIAIMFDLYAKEMKQYHDNSIVEYNGESVIIPVGEINIMRLYHHASTKVSCSFADYAYKRTLRFGEQEKMNLVANDCPNILRELGIRSVSKYIGSHYHIDQMEKTRELPKNTRLNLTFAEILKSMGYDISVDGKSLTGTDYSFVNKDDIDRLNSMYKGDSNCDNDEDSSNYDTGDDGGNDD